MSGSAECPLPPPKVFRRHSRRPQKHVLSPTAGRGTQRPRCSYRRRYGFPMVTSPNPRPGEASCGSMLLQSSNAVSRPNRYFGGRGHGAGRGGSCPAQRDSITSTADLSRYAGRECAAGAAGQSKHVKAPLERRLGWICELRVGRRNRIFPEMPRGY